MASVVDICNLALSNLGDTATVSSIDPPEGSAQAEHCARWYPIARDALLEMHGWSFASRRALLALLENPVTQWRYCYAAPVDMVNPISVLPPEADSDMVIPASLPQTSTPTWPESYWMPIPNTAAAPQEFAVESSATGAPVIYTNQEGALLRYTSRDVDPTRFSPLFVRTLAASMSSMLAGPLLKGDAGMAAAARWQGIAFGPDARGGLFLQAATSDANQRTTRPRNVQPAAWSR
jgi:hypothetical protein